MDKNFFIAILLSTLIIIIYASPLYQKRLGRNITREPTTGQTRSDSLSKTATVPPGIADYSASPEIMPPKPEQISAAAEPDSSVTAIVQINIPGNEDDFMLENEDIRLTLSRRGGAIREAVLKKFEGMTPGNPVQIIKDGESWYDGYIREDETDISLHDIVFSTTQISRNHAVLEAELTGNKTITREYTLKSAGFLLEAKTDLTGQWNDPHIYFTWHGPINETEEPVKKLKIWPFSMLMRDDTSRYIKIVYLGQGDRATISANGKEKSKRIYSKEGGQKLEGNKRGEEEDHFNGDLDWYAVRNKYFITAGMPHEKMRWEAFSQSYNNGNEKWFEFTLGKKLSDGTTAMDIYLGPISYDTLKGYGKNLTQAMELSFKFIRPISIGFLWFIKKLHTVIPNWGLVIIVFSIVIKVVLYPLSKTSYDSMRKMSALQPQIAELKAKYKNNPQQQQKATMELYKKEGVNPFSGCLPMLLQLPVFFALYPVVGRAFELRQAMFIPHWIEDLSRPDPFYILPVAMGISMFFQSKTTMKDPNQKAMLYIMPVMMVILFANFSSGLTLYWFMFNIMSFLQQKIHT